jgi:hypothetical protein
VRWTVLLALACGACAGGADPENVGPLTLGSSAGTDATTTSGASAPDSESESSAGEACDGECEPGDRETRPCPGMCAVQERICDDDCTFDAWSVCGENMGACEPGDTMSCGMCMQQTCSDACEWGACEAVPCVFECQSAARNGSEICDDEGFQMPDNGKLFLYCEDANGGIAYVANNTGPAVGKDPVQRCQGWELMGLNAWDYLDYVYMTKCDVAGKYWEIPFAPGTISHYGVHNDPSDGSGTFTTVCVATLVE